MEFKVNTSKEAGDFLSDRLAELPRAITAQASPTRRRSEPRARPACEAPSRQRPAPLRTSAAWLAPADGSVAAGGAFVDAGDDSRRDVLASEMLAGRDAQLP